MNFKQFSKVINNGKFSPVYIFTGSDKYLIEVALEELKEKYLNPATVEFNYNTFSGEEEEAGQILNALNMLPIMGEKRLVVVEDGFLNNLDEEMIKNFKEYLENPLSSTIFIICEEKPDKRRKAYKLFKKEGEEVEMKKLDRISLISFINKTLKQGGVRADRNTINYLIERTHYLDSDEMDTMRLKNALESVNVYTLGGQLTEEIIDEVIPETVEDNVFKIMDLIVRGKLEGVYPILDNFWLQGESPIRIFSLLIYQLRNILKLKIAMEKSRNQSELSKITGIQSFVVRKSIPVAKSYSLDRLYELYEEAGNLDFDMKIGNIDPKEGLEYYLLKLHKKK